LPMIIYNYFFKVQPKFIYLVFLIEA